MLEAGRCTPIETLDDVIARDNFRKLKVGATTMSVDELQAAVSHLSRGELSRFTAWFEEFLADRWDEQIEADILAGRLDEAGRRADQDFEAGRCTPLP